jgi:immune inhibitor A
VGDYTVQPENGGLGVFAHEYGHDLGLPDEYDTTGQPNIVNWWTLMAQDRVSAPGEMGVGTRANDLGAWDKLQLGWLDYEIVKAGQTKTLDLGPHEYNSAKAQGVVVVLPQKDVTTTLPKPAAGAKSWWSGQGDNLNNTLSRTVALPAQPATLTMRAQWDIEDCGPDACDYAYVEVDDGSGFTAIPGSITKPAEGNGIDGRSKGWESATFDLARYAGKTVGLRLRYATDTNTGGKGFFADELAITAGATTVFADGAETGDNGWTTAGFSAVGDSVTKAYDNYYVASHRSYVAYDRYLQSGPYTYGFLNTRPNWVEHYPYQEGLLVSYWDTSYRDNNTSTHPGGGLILPIDSRPDLVYKLDGQPWKPTVQGYDAPFSLAKAASFTLHSSGQASYIRGQNGQSLFDDTRSYYREDLVAGMRYGVKLPKAGVKIKVLSRDGTSMRVKIS